MFKITTAGESHGPALVVIIEGVPYGLNISQDYINNELSRRQKGYGRGGRMKIENDKIEVLSGIRSGKTIASPVCFKIENRDWPNWVETMGADVLSENIDRITKPRPGHADLAGSQKYGSDDIRNILERSSARETAARVAGGAVAKNLLSELDIKIFGYVNQIGGVVSPHEYKYSDYHEIEKSQVRCPDPKIDKKMIEAIDQARQDGDSLGGQFTIKAEGVPSGLGSHVSYLRKLDGRLAQAIMSIPAIKAIAIGEGLSISDKKGSEVHDQIYYEQEKGFYRQTNRAGGIEGGITNGEDIIVRAIMKPIPTLTTPLKTVDMDLKKEVLAHKERSDVCAIPSAVVIGEAMVAIVLADEILRKFYSDNMELMKKSYQDYLKTIK